MQKLSNYRIEVPPIYISFKKKMTKPKERVTSPISFFFGFYFYVEFSFLHSPTLHI
jgi:hypothetical protein